MQNENIVTGIDKLIQIIDSAGGRINIKDAMKRMNVSRELVEEWANSLEENKTITIEYKLFNTFLVRGISKTELVKKAKELTLKEEAFKQKVLFVVKDFTTESKGLDELGQEFDKLSEEIKSKGKHIEEQLKNLYEFDKLNKAFAEELKLVDKRTSDYMASIEDAIQKKKKEYDSLLMRLSVEKKNIDEKGQHLQSVLDSANKLSQEIELAKGGIRTLQEQAAKLRPEIEVLEKKGVESFLAQQKEALDRISSKQSTFLNEIMLKRRFMALGLQESQLIKEKLDTFVHKQQALQEKFTRLSSMRNEVIAELNSITHLAEEYKILSRKKELSREFSALEKRYDAAIEKKKLFNKEIQELKGAIEAKKEIRQDSPKKLHRKPKR